MKKRLFQVSSGVLLMVLGVTSLTYLYTTHYRTIQSVAVEIVVKADTVQPYKPVYYYGFNTDSVEVLQGRVKRNQNLSEILAAHNVDHQTIYELSIRAKGVYDLRKIGVYKRYELICQPDSLASALALVYYPNKVEYVVFNLTDSIYVVKGQKEVVTVEKTASGIIDNSLAVTMDEIGLSPLLTNDIADVFAWEIDFFKLYPGDRFKVIYEEKLVDGEVIGYGDIKGAVFEHEGEDHYAFFYDQGTGIEYFDETGESLQKTLLKYPVKFSRISSRYSGNRFHPVQKRYKAHRGTDFAAPRGTPIRSVGDGVVVEAKYHKYNGNYVKIKHNSIYSTQYLHMSKIAGGMRPGAKVKQGQTIGYVGSTGLARGNHVCYRFWKHGRQVDALRVDIPSSEPVEEGKMLEFAQLAGTLKSQLDAIGYPLGSTPSIGK
jgi:murein DD-endopeptidase MepM/ murein hydrolase activator NlpD